MKYKVGDKVKYDNEVVTIVGYVRNLNWYLVQGYSNGWRKTNDSYETYGIKVPNMTCGLMWANQNSLEPVTNRSKIGKKAYKTFLKNGGSRNSKGQFSNTQNIYWEKLGKDLEDTFWDTPDLISEVKMVKALAKVFQKHGLIDKGVEI